ncbi:hypothetical protein METBIDRAFT_79026 [Metschnikowia bicuspidata var. bicuspidata NRRL YB-4993]|uniref:NEDD8-conjugating enzyme UBC12 n=1 Tax=Metschnikowia bicuspidata var. bicuspidata NRRL YB-4993 TaxID=869754 RepID=A0A1A0H9P9_9ASCO|nr:hypothetical protein METBIDRAFT_79026 [Metschnikowia bicuspidata var. bicuspidata NRRL YB-4993]OBA20741.1 hypothetical protein METBIDRAFT_79026 [Metschnikowia bicuspidata var. bicuspidata NRRL YB-4993]
MLKIRQLQKQKQQQNAQLRLPADEGVHGKVSAAQIRLQKDITELELPQLIAIHLPDPQDLFHFNIEICPVEGHYKAGRFRFKVEILENYPIDPPRIKCVQKIYHPNIDLEGNVCLNILRQDWSPVLSLNAVLLGLNFLFLELNPNDPLNKDAANMLVKNPALFSRNVSLAMRGLYVGLEVYDRVI